jgi:outer membrane usher protein FimD/PapC
MAGGLRFRSECTLVSSKGTNYTIGGSPISIVPTSQLVGIQRVGVFRLIIVAVAATTIQFQDTGGNILSAQYPLGINGALTLDTPINGDPWWATTAAGLGLQLLLTGTGPVAADIWVGFGA